MDFVQNNIILEWNKKWKDHLIYNKLALLLVEDFFSELLQNEICYLKSANHVVIGNSNKKEWELLRFPEFMGISSTWDLYSKSTFIYSFEKGEILYEIIDSFNWKQMYELLNS